MMCAAYDSTNRYLACSTSDPTLVTLIGKVNTSSYISFSANASGQCTSLTVFNDSAYPPTAP
jgi:hypothetical protein